MSSRSATMLNGGEVQVSSSVIGIDQGPGFTTWQVFGTGAGHQEFGCGSRGFGEICAGDHGIELKEELKPADNPGTLLLGQATRVIGDTGYAETVFLGVWRGERFDLKSTSYRGYDHLVELFNSFALEEVELGVRMVARRAGLDTVIEGPHPPVALIYPAELGLIEIRARSSVAAKTIPARGQGLGARGGEVFVEDHLSDSPTLLLVGDTTLTRVYPKVLDESEAVEATRDLLVSLKPA